jgi:hypothetical protein
LFDSAAHAGLRRAVIAADQHVFHALLQLAIIAGPGIVRRQVGGDPGEHFARQGFGLITRHAAGHIENQFREHSRRIGQLIGQ